MTLTQMDIASRLSNFFKGPDRQQSIHHQLLSDCLIIVVIIQRSIIDLLKHLENIWMLQKGLLQLQLCSSNSCRTAAFDGCFTNDVSCHIIRLILSKGEYHETKVRLERYCTERSGWLKNYISPSKINCAAAGSLRINGRFCLVRLILGLRDLLRYEKKCYIYLCICPCIVHSVLLID